MPWGLVLFYGISTIGCYLMSNPLYTYILNIYDLVWLGFMTYQPLWLFNVKSSLYIYIKYIGFGLVGFYGISTIVGYLMPTPLYTYIYIKYIGFGLVGFYGISTIVDYSMPNPFYTYISNIYNLVWLGFMAYQPL